MPDYRRQRQSLLAQIKGHIPLFTPYALVDFPSYENVGDSAIWLGAVKALAEVTNRYPVYVCDNRSLKPKRLMEVDGPIFITGGGNFGDLWPHHQAFRERLMREFPNKRIIQLPQSIHFDDPANVERCAKAIAAHGNFHLMVRDRASLRFAEEHFDCPVSLAPDCAVALDLKPIGRPVFDHLLLLRNDKERAGRVELDGHRKDWPADTRFITFLQKVSWRTGLFHRSLAKLRLRQGIALLSSGKQITTDRLHGHILATQLGIPHTILDNSYGKVRGYWSEWTKGSRLVNLT